MSYEITAEERQQRAARDEERREERRQRNERIPFDWQLVKIDQTIYCDPGALAKLKIERCGVIYVFDANRHVHICSFTPSYELQAVAPFVTTIAGFDPSEEENEALGEFELELMSGEDIDYSDVRDVLRMEGRPIHWAPEREADEDAETYYHRALEEFREYYAGNPPYFAGPYVPELSATLRAAIAARRAGKGLTP
jgi:hypothetical protein